MRIALVIERYLGSGGGVERAAFQLVRALASREIDLTVVCREADAAAAAGASLVAVGGPRFWQPLRVIEFSRRAGHATRGYDVVHSYSRTRHQHIYRAGGGSHAAYLERAFPGSRSRHCSPRHRVLLAIEAAIFRDASQWIQCNSRQVAEEIASRHGVPRERLVTIYNGVDAQEFTPERREARGGPLRRALRLEGPVALFVGSGFQRKGLDRALDALARSGSRAQLLVAGRDDPSAWRERAQHLGVAGRVHFLGERADVADLHAAADLLVLPTRYDAFANACLEAMASGLPVATTPTNGAAELIEPGVSGWVLEEDFGPAFAALEDPERLRRMGAAARQRAEALTWEAHADQVLALYARVAR